MEKLLYYCETGNNLQVRAIMEEHYIPNDISPDIITDKSGRTALFISIMNSWTFYELPQYLLSNGASLEAKDVNGKLILYEVIEDIHPNFLNLRESVTGCASLKSTNNSNHYGSNFSRYPS